MERFYRFFAERHTLAMVLTFMIAALGVSTLFVIQRDMFPKVEFGEVLITTRYPGASPEDVELNVTNEIEEELKEVVGIDWYTSYSMENISVIHVVVDSDVDNVDDVVDDIREAVNRVTDLPREVTEAPYVDALSTSIFPVIEIGVTGDVDYRELREYSKVLERKIENLEGVSSIQKFSYRDREVHVEVDPQALDRLQVSLGAVINAIQQRNVRSTGGTFESYTDEKNVVTLAQFKSPEEVGDVIVRSSFDGPMVRVKDVARVKDTFEEPRVLSRMNGQFAISLLVFKKENADVIRTVDEVRALLDGEKPLMPQGVEISTSDDFSRYVRTRMHVVVSNGLIGLALVLVLLGLFLSVRSAFWVALGIPVTLLGTIFMLPFFGQHLDVIGMAALIMIIGIVVDDAIIIAENIHRKRELGLEPVDAAVQGLKEVARPVVTTVATTFAAFAPMFFMSGMLGKFVVVIPLVITLGLAVSLAEAFLALPAHLIAGLRKRGAGAGHGAERGWFDVVRRFYRSTIYYVLKARYLVIVVSLAMLAGGLWHMIHQMDFVLFPDTASDEFYVRVELPRGTSLAATADKVAEIEKIVEELPEGEVDSYVTRVGNQGNFVLGENENWAILAVYLTPYSTRDRTASQIVASMRERTSQLSGFDHILYYIDAGGPPVGRDVTMRIVGSDDARRAQLADSVVAVLGSMAGVSDIDRNDKRGKDQIEIEVDYDKLSRLGLTVADVARTVRIAYDGEIVTSVRYGDEDVEYRVLLAEGARRKPSSLKDLLIPNAYNRLIPLGEVAKLVAGPGSSSFFHFGGERAVLVTADVDKDVTTPLQVTNEVQNHFDLARDWNGFRFVIGGESEQTQESMRSLYSAFISALFAIYLLLVLLFNSLVQPLLVMSAIPLGVIGVIIAFVLHGEPLGFTAMMGLIGLSGVVVNDSLVLVNYINRLRSERPKDRAIDIVSDAAAERLRAILLTTLTTVAGLLPLAYGIGGSDPFIAPMALAMGFGLLFASPITLALVPSLYLANDDVWRLLRRFVRAVRRPRLAESGAPGREGAGLGSR
jgi:multidrug efflux pump subunit AcrB